MIAEAVLFDKLPNMPSTAAAVVRRRAGQAAALMGKPGHFTEQVADLPDQLCEEYPFAVLGVVGHPKAWLVPDRRYMLFEHGTLLMGRDWAWGRVNERLEENVDTRANFQFLFGREAVREWGISIWEDLANQALRDYAKGGMVEISDMGVSIGQDFLADHIRDVFQGLGRRDAEECVRVCLDDIGAGYWPIRRMGDRFVFNDSDHFYFLAANNFFDNNEGGRLTPRYSASVRRGVVWPFSVKSLYERMKDAGCLKREHIKHLLPLYSHIAEKILVDGREDSLMEFLRLVSSEFGGQEGIAVARLVLDDLSGLYPRPSDPEKERLHRVWRLDRFQTRLKSAGDDLVEREKNLAYRTKPDVISYDVLQEALRDPLKFWDIIFERTGAKEEMERMFGKRSETRPVYETAILERKVIAGLVMVCSQLMGFDRQNALELAAISQFAWGYIVNYDNIIDNHPVRKGEMTMVGREGIPNALDRTMLALAEILGKTIGDEKLEIEFLNMLGASCSANLESRKLNFETPIEEHRKTMQNLIVAFSWFPAYIGQKTGYAEAGFAFSGFSAAWNALGQLNNDIEDIDPGVKHDAGNDIGRRMTLFWKTLYSLPDEILSTEKKEKVRRVFEETHACYSKGKTPDSKLRKRINEIIGIGLAHRRNVAVRLTGTILDLYQQANNKLDISFDSLPDIEGKDVYQEILRNNLQYLRQRLFGY